MGLLDDYFGWGDEVQTSPPPATSSTPLKRSSSYVPGAEPLPTIKPKSNATFDLNRFFSGALDTLGQYGMARAALDLRERRLGQTALIRSASPEKEGPPVGSQETKLPEQSKQWYQTPAMAGGAVLLGVVALVLLIKAK
jgi:hypothetical protein